jgi:hypothetical protein
MRRLVRPLVAGALVGLGATAVEWRPRPGVEQTGFPFPIGVTVRREDGSFDSGAGMIGWYLNPLVFMAASVAVWVLLVVLRSRARR